MFGRERWRKRHSPPETPKITEKPPSPFIYPAENDEQSKYEFRCVGALTKKDFSPQNFAQFTDSMIHLLGGLQHADQKISHPLVLPNSFTDVIFEKKITQKGPETKIKLTNETISGKIIEIITAYDNNFSKTYSASLQAKFYPHKEYDSLATGDKRDVTVWSAADFGSTSYDLNTHGRKLCKKLFGAFEATQLGDQSSH